MGQYWTMKNLTKKEVLNTHALCSGLKYMEQWLSGSLYSAMMVLLTDMTSLGYGGGDFHMDRVPKEFEKFILPVIGSWAGDRIVFSGDYTKNEQYAEIDDDGTFDQPCILHKLLTYIHNTRRWGNLSRHLGQDCSSCLGYDCMWCERKRWFHCDYQRRTPILHEKQRVEP